METGTVASARPLPWPASAWRYAAAVLLGLVSYAGALLSDQHGTASALVPLGALDLLGGALALVLVHWRRRYPLAVGLATNALTAISAAGVGAAALATVSVATRRRWREILPVSLVSVAAQTAFVGLPGSGAALLGATVLGLAGQAAVVATGMYLGARRDLAASQAEQALRAQQQQERQITEARASERARIAREMHDVLAHRLSLVAMHAGALSYRRGLSEEQVAGTADVIRSTTHEALTDLREILGVLRADDADGAPQRPQPTLSDVPALVQETLAAGGSVRLQDEVGDLAAAPDTLGRSAYRVVQEALTNARKHAPDTTVDVVLRGRPGGELVVEVSNPARVGARVGGTPGAGLGLVGLEERAELAGGLLEHGTRDGRFVVQARLPWPA